MTSMICVTGLGLMIEKLTIVQLSLCRRETELY